MKNKIVQITSSVTTVAVQKVQSGVMFPGEEAQQVIVVVFGLAEDGNLYQLDNGRWKKVCNSPDKEN